MQYENNFRLLIKCEKNEHQNTTRNCIRRCRKAEPDIADQTQMSPIGSRPRSPYPTARDQQTQKAAATIIERYGIYRAPNKVSVQNCPGYPEKFTRDLAYVKTVIFHCRQNLIRRIVRFRTTENEKLGAPPGFQ